MGREELGCAGGRGPRGLRWPLGSSGGWKGAERLQERKDLRGNSPLPEPSTQAAGFAALRCRGLVVRSTS